MFKRKRPTQTITNSEGKVWLNVASSVCVLENFINFDNHVLFRFIFISRLISWILPGKYHAIIEQYRSASARASLIRHDCRKSLPLYDEVVDHILCSHFLEHVYPEEADDILRDFRRVLKNGGTVHIIVPDLMNHVKQYISRSGLGINTAADEFVVETLLARESRGTLKYRILEFVGGFGLQHRWMYDHSSMKLKLEKAGFELATIDNMPSKDYRFNDGSVHIGALKK